MIRLITEMYDAYHELGGKFTFHIMIRLITTQCQMNSLEI